MLKLNTLDSPRPNYLAIFAICALLYAPSFDIIFMYIPLPNSSLLIYGSTFILMALALFQCFIHRFALVLGVMIGALLLLFSSTWINPGVSYHIFYSWFNLNGNPFYMYYLWGVPLIPLLCSKFSTKTFFSVFKKYSIVMLILGIYVYIYYGLVLGKHVDYIVMSYFIELPSFIFCIDGFAKGRRSSKYIGVMGCVIAVISGGRGTLITLMEFILFLYIYSFRNSFSKKRVVGLIVFAAISLSVIINYEIIATGLNTFLESFGIESRALEQLTGDSFLELNGRDEIIINIWGHIKENIFGGGMWSDRYYNLLDLGKASYSHNIIIEILCDFGFGFGGLLIVLALYYIVKEILLKKDDCLHMLFLVALPFVFGKLMFSGSYLVDNMFFFFVGILARRFAGGDKEVDEPEEPLHSADTEDRESPPGLQTVSGNSGESERI